MQPSATHLGVRHRALVASIMCLGLAIGGAQVARAGGEIIPSVGWSAPTDNDADAKVFGGLAFRGNFIPLFKTELAVAYREEKRFDDDLKLRMWPVTASLYFAPSSMIYAGAGVGWYHTTFDFDSSVPVADRTTEDFGVHLGGGVGVPLGPSMGVDLNGKYVMLREQDARLVPGKFDPDFWSAQLGLAFKF